MVKKWIQGVVKNMKKGSFRRWAQKHGFKKVTPQAIALAIKIAKKTGNTTLLRRALLARTFMKLRKGK